MVHLKMKVDKGNSYSLLKPLFIPMLLVSTTLVGGCSDSSEYAESSADMESVQASESVTAVGANGQATALEVENLSSDSEQTLSSEAADIQIEGKQLLITASANFKVDDVVKSSNAIERLTRQQGGYVALSNISNRERDSRTFSQSDKNITLTTYYRQARMTVRVPRANVNKFLDQVQQQVAFLNEQEFSAQDVTLDIYRQQLSSNLNSDMANELSAQRLSSDDAEDQSSNIDSITATYSARQQQEYAQLEQMNIEDMVKYSTIDLTFTQPDISYKETTQNLDVVMNAERPSFGSQVGEAFKAGWQTLQVAVITLIQLWWLLIIGGILYLIYRVIKGVYRKLSGYKHKGHRVTDQRNALINEPIRDKEIANKDIKEDIDDHHF